MLFGSVFWFPMMLNDPCDHRYVLYALGEGPGNLWEASGLPPQPPGVIAGGVRLVSFSALSGADKTNRLFSFKDYLETFPFLRLLPNT